MQVGWLEQQKQSLVQVGVPALENLRMMWVGHPELENLSLKPQEVKIQTVAKYLLKYQYSG